MDPAYATIEAVRFGEKCWRGTPADGPLVLTSQDEK